ncbi:Armadillo [Corchorus olitorius]|uniref:Armadillo n=1 Tax=Corchorus olitorius TaxID=93759 RepID=A0A1R3JG21_9ROSI|nr:Armadillo [Corchorus olitorius]
MKAPENDPIALSNQLLSSLSEQIQNINNFKGKWAMIKSKLSSLQAQLADFSDFPASSSNPLAVDLLYSISNTLKDAVSLAQKCKCADLTEGKLKTQSDIDAVLAKLDRHIKDSEILIRSGVLQDGAVSTSSSKKEAVRVESRNLITRLQIGTTESKNSAMDSLLGLLQEDDKNVMIAVAQGVVPVLVRLLDSSSLEMKEKTVAAISRVSTVESSKHVLIAEGLLLLNHLLRVLESGSGFAREKACIALQALSFSKENARAIGSRGGISALLEICQAGTPGSQAFAAGVLKNLASFDEIKENFIEENAVFVLIGLAASGTALAQENSIGCLCNLVSNDENLKLLIVKEGGVECLKNFWDSSPNPKSLEVAVELVRQLASCPLIADALVADGFVARLVTVLNCGVLGVRIAAARAVYELGFNSKTRKEMGEYGCTVALIKMLDGKAVEEKEAAAMALSTLLLYAGNRKIFRKDERGIVNAVQLLDPSIQNLDKKYPVLILSELVHSKKCRKQMVAAGACLHLQKLVEMNVEGAKKLLESLGRGKIWGVFARP